MHSCRRARTPRQVLAPESKERSCVSEELIDKYILEVETFDHRPGRFSGGLAIVDSFIKYANEELGNKALPCVALKRDANEAFDNQRLGLSSRRTALAKIDTQARAAGYTRKSVGKRCPWARTSST